MIYYTKVANCPLTPFLPPDVLQEGGALHFTAFFTP
jgi:hypothetical protein